MTPLDSGAEVRHTKKTSSRGVLLELAKCGDRTKLQEAIKIVVGDKEKVRTIDPKLRLAILDHDVLITDADVTEAFQQDHPNLSGELKVTLFMPNNRDQRKTVVHMNEGGSPSNPP